MSIDLGTQVWPYWTIRRSTGVIEVRLWTGYSWVEFGCDVHLAPEEVNVLRAIEGPNFPDVSGNAQ